MEQPALNFRAPINGITRSARHASWTGARAVQDGWTARQAEYLALLENGPLTDWEASQRLSWPLSSVCSIRNSVREQLAPDGFETAVWQSGRTTKRTRWRRQR